MYGILRANKIKLTSVTKRFQKHIQRQSNYYHSNPDIDVSKQNEDIILVFSENFKTSIFEELKKHNITKKPRKNAVGIIDGVITASPCSFTNRSKIILLIFLSKHFRLSKRNMDLLYQQQYTSMKKLLIYIFVLPRLLKMQKGIINYLQKM